MSTPQNIVLDAEDHPVDSDHTTDGNGGQGPGRRPLSRGRLIRRRFLRSKSGMVGLVMLTLLIIFAVIGPYISKYSYTEIDYANVLAKPTPAHWFGGDQIGQDVFARVIHGLRKSLLIGLVTALITTAIAAVGGSIAGYFGGFTDIGVTWVIDLLLALPAFLILAILSTTLSGHSWLLLVPLLAVFGWMITGRVVRGMTRSLKEREYVQAARFMGVSAPRIIWRHLMPNMASLLIVDVTINVGATVLAESSLSFFGFGVQPPDVSLGSIIGDYYNYAYTYPFTFWPAAISLIIMVLAVSLIGDALRDAIDPTSGASRL